MAKHYIEIDTLGQVILGFSDEFERPLGDAVICICENGGRHFVLGGEENPLLVNQYGVPLYKFDGEHVVRKTESELVRDADESYKMAPTIEDRTSALEAALLELVLGGVV